MTLTFKSLNKKGNAATYTGAAQPIRLSLAAFEGRNAPPTIEVADGLFAPAKTAKHKLSKEERAALPKPTLAEKVAKAEQRLAKMREKAAAEGNQPLM